MNTVSALVSSSHRRRVRQAKIRQLERRVAAANDAGRRVLTHADRAADQLETAARELVKRHDGSLATGVRGGPDGGT